MRHGLHTVSEAYWKRWLRTWYISLLNDPGFCLSPTAESWSVRVCFWLPLFAGSWNSLALQEVCASNGSIAEFVCMSALV